LASQVTSRSPSHNTVLSSHSRHAAVPATHPSEQLSSVAGNPSLPHTFSTEPSHSFTEGAHVLHRPAASLQPGAPHGIDTMSSPAPLQNNASVPEQPRNASASHWTPVSEPPASSGVSASMPESTTASGLPASVPASRVPESMAASEPPVAASRPSSPGLRPCRGSVSKLHPATHATAQKVHARLFARTDTLQTQ
jgi:hypothetical protein